MKFAEQIPYVFRSCENVVIRIYILACLNFNFVSKTGTDYEKQRNTEPVDHKIGIFTVFDCPNIGDKCCIII